MFLKKHLQSNKGDANVSKMTLIAVVFVVGAILLVLTTSAFRNPINRWFAKVSNDWFASENGEFNLMDSQFAMYERNENGTIKGVKYICTDGDRRYVLIGAESLKNGEFSAWRWNVCDANGNPVDEWHWDTSGTPTISDDGSTITWGADGYGWDNMTFVATPVNP